MMSAIRPLLWRTLSALALALSANLSQGQTLQVWTMGMKPRFTPLFEEMRQRYQAQHPGVTVEWTDYPHEVLQARLAAALAAGKPPALVQLNAPWAGEYARKGLLQPVDAELGKPAPYLGGPLADLQFQGKTWGFPHYTNANVLAYNKSLLAAAGVTQPPQTLEQILSTAERVAAKTGQAGFAPPLGKMDNYFLQQSLPLFKDGRAVFNSPAHIAFVERFRLAYEKKALLKDGLFAENNFSQVLAAYNSKRLAMMLGATAVIKRVQGDAPAVFADTGIAAAPLGPGGIADGGWLFHFAIPKQSEASISAPAAQLARFLTNDANQLAFARAANVFPTSAKAAADSWFSQLPANPDANDLARVQAGKSVAQARTLYVAGIDDYQQMQRALSRAVEAAVTGRMPVKQALDEAVAFCNRQLEKSAKPGGK
ncbi:extracellular solute-binding protein [Massilia sp. W12]|uniref:extracellular solute-binding protein n=1 Tax=Massilia sp. W12 TaxID=3126507 RepID=UPI0030CB257E